MSRPISIHQLVAEAASDQHMNIPGTNEARFNCPFCNDTKYHLYANTSKGVYHCFKCGASGKILRRKEDTLVELDKLKSRVETYTSSKKETLQSSTTKEKEVRTIPITIPAIDSPKAYSYLRTIRGLTDDEITRNCLQYCYQGEYLDSIVIPVPTTYNNKVDYFTCRTLRPHGPPKYRNAPWPKGSTVYEPWTLQLGAFTRVICEGPFDAIRISRITSSWALLGKRASREQLEWICERQNGVIILLDPEAYIEALRLKLELESKGVMAEIAELTRTDPGDSTEEEIREVVSHADFQLRSRSSKRG